MTETEFKKLLWDSANKLRGAMSAAEYKFPVLGLVFLKYVSDIFEAQREVIRTRLADPDSDLFMPEDMRADAFAALSEDRDAYKQDNVFWIPEEARFGDLLKQAASPKLGKLLDDGMAAIERENDKLRGVLYRDFARLPLEDGVLGDLMGIVKARQLSLATMSNIRLNLWFAFGYNVLGVPIAAGVLYPFFGILLSPVVAAAAMALSSVSVIANSLRLRRSKLGD